MEVPSIWTPSCPEPDSNQDPCHDDGREHRPGEDDDDDNDEDEDENVGLEEVENNDGEDEEDKANWDEGEWGSLIALVDNRQRHKEWRWSCDLHSL